MDDLISRRAVMNSLTDEYNRKGTGEGLRLAWIEKAVNGTPSAWVSVKDRLPELDEDGYSDMVLVCFWNWSLMELCQYRKTEDGAYDGWYLGDLEDNVEAFRLKVAAWMPLPERYRGEGEE